MPKEAKMVKHKKAQAIMGFLSSYGWVLLLILIAVSVFAFIFISAMGKT